MFVLLVLAISSLSGCSNSGAGNQANATENESGGTANSANTEVAKEKSNSDFPDVPASIMQADLRLVEDGSNFKLADKKSKVVLVNMWGIWCVPCKAEMPHLIELQEKYRDQGFEIVGLNVGDENAEKEDPEKIKSFGQKTGLNYQLVQGEDQLQMDFVKLSKFEGVPQSFLIDRDGKLKGVFLGGGQNTINKIKENVAKEMNGAS